MTIPRTHARSVLAVLFVGLITSTLSVSTLSTSATAADGEFTVRFSKAVRAEPFTGRVLLLFSNVRREPRTGPGWFNPEFFVAQDVADWKPDTLLVFSAKTPGKMLAHPKPLAEMNLAGYRAQAVARLNPHVRNIGTGTGNGFSQVVVISGEDAKTPTFVIDELVPERKFAETKWSKLLRVRSKKLSKFHGRDVFMNAAVILPASYYDQPKRRYPTIYTIPGFGGTHFGGSRTSPIAENNERGVEFIRVLLDPSCPLGHHVFADSANNGPVGTALVTELIPAFDKTLRSVGKPTARFLTGHSSGGWSSLWVQVAYPDDFGGTWSTAPDPVDFRDFQRINLYRAGENMYVDAGKKRRPLARVGGQVRLWYQGFADMEWTLGPGGQLHSFEAVFSPRGKDGKPRLIWDRKTGKVDTAVAKTWEKYDIRLVLERNWKTLGPKLKGKLHVIMGDSDTFYLEGASILLKKSLKDIGSDGYVEIVPGRDHMNLLTPDIRNRIRREMTTAFLKNHPDRQ